MFLEYSSKAIRGLKLGAIRDLRKIAASRDFSFCIAHRFKPVYIALLATRLPVIGVHHAFGDYHRRSRKLFAHLFRGRLSLLGVSDAVRDDMRSCLPKWPTGRIQTLYNRIDIEQLQASQLPAAQAREELGLSPTAWIVGNVGRLHPDKDQATLLRGFRPRTAEPAGQQPTGDPRHGPFGAGSQRAGAGTGHRFAGAVSRSGTASAPLLQGLRRVCPELRSRAIRHGAARSHGRWRSVDRDGCGRCQGSGRRRRDSVSAG